MTQEKERFKSVKLPLSMWLKLKQAAAANERTIAEEIAAQITK